MPQDVVRMVAKRFPDLLVHLASNSSLTPELWTELYTKRTPVAAAERLMWFAGLTPELVAHALEGCGETRKAPLAALVVQDSKMLAPHLQHLISGPLSVQVADLLMDTRRLSFDMKTRVAPSASYRSGVLHLLGDHRSVSDEDALRILTECAKRSRFYRNNWSILPAMLVDRPRLRDMVAKSDPAPILAYAVARTGVGASAQEALVRTILAYDDEYQSARLRCVEALYAHPCTTKETISLLDEAATKDPSVRSGLSATPLGWGVDLTKMRSRRRVDQLLKGRVNVWWLTSLSTNPSLSPEQRGVLTSKLTASPAKDALANVHPAALSRAETGQGDLLVKTAWRVGSQVGDAQTLYDRLGTRSRFDGYEAPTTSTGDEQRLKDLASRYTYEDDQVMAGRGLAYHLKDDLAAWEIALSMADAFEGTVEDLAVMALACTA